MQYDLEYHKQLDRQHILPNILQGAQTGILSQFLSDIFISLFLYNDQIFFEDINISPTASYYASVASGMMAGLLVIFIDPIALVAFTTITYGVTYEIADKIITGDEITFTPVEDIFDIGLSIILVFLFDPAARSQYYRYQQKRHFIEPSIPRRDRTLSNTIFFSVLLSSYGFLKLTNQEKAKNEDS